MLLRIKISTQIVVVLNQEVGLTDTNPEEFGVLGKKLINLTVTVGIDIRESALTILLLVDSGREQTYVTKRVRIVDSDEEAVETTHRQTGDGAVSLVLLDAVGLLDELNHIGECCLKTSLHGLWQHHGWYLETLAGLTRTSLLRDVAVGHHQNHWLGLTLSNEVVHNLSSTSQLAPGVLVATDTVQQVEHWIILAAGLVAGWCVDSEAACKSSSRTLVPYFAYCAMSHLVNLVQIGTLVATNQQNAEQIVDVADVVNIQWVDNLYTVNNHVVGVEFGLQRFCGIAPHALLVLYQINHSRGVVGVTAELYLLCWQHIAGNLHLFSLGGNQIKCYTVVGMYIG